MTSDSTGNRSFADEKIGTVFLALDVDLRQCVTCSRVFSRQGAYEHSKTICYPPASSAN